MRKEYMAGILVFCAGFIAAFVLIGYYEALRNDDEADMLPRSLLHAVTDVPADTIAPTLALEVEVDPTDGFNIHLVTQDFTFSPQSVGGPSTPNVGHANLYINGQKVARVYGSWYHVSEDMLSYGQNTIEVRLAADDHTEWAANGEIIKSAAVVERVQ